MFKRTGTLAVITAALFSLAFSTAAQAQWGRNDDYRRDDDHYGRDRRDRRDDSYGRYDGRTMRDAASRIKDRSKDLQRNVDRLLDNSRHDDTRREDHVNDDVSEFRNAAERFKSRIGNGRDLNRGANEARALLSAAQHVEQMLSRLRVDSRTNSDWNQISRDLNLVADAYGINYRGDDGYRNGRYDPRYPDDRNRDRRRDDSYNDNWWRRLPDILRRP